MVGVIIPLDVERCAVSGCEIIEFDLRMVNEIGSKFWPGNQLARCTSYWLLLPTMVFDLPNLDVASPTELERDAASQA